MPATAEMSSVPIRPWTSSRLSAAISAAAPNASHNPPPAARTSANIPRIATVPSNTLGSRQASGPSPNSSIPPAISSLTREGCSELPSTPSGAFAYGAPAGGRIPAITRAAFT
jgi:hypothetical protein